MDAFQVEVFDLKIILNQKIQNIDSGMSHRVLTVFDLFEISSKKINLKCSELTTKNEELMLKCSQLTTENKKIKLERSQFTNKLAQFEKKKNTIQIIKPENSQFNIELTKTNLEQKEIIKGFKSKFSELTEENENNKKEIEKKKKRNNTLSRENSRLTYKLSETRRKYKTEKKVKLDFSYLKKRVKRLESFDMNQFIERAERHITEVASMQKESVANLEEITRLKSLCNDFRVESENSMTKLMLCEEKNEKLTSLRTNMVSTILGLKLQQDKSLI